MSLIKIRPEQPALFFMIIIISVFFTITGCSDTDPVSVPEKVEEYFDISVLSGTKITKLPLEWKTGSYGGTWHGTYTEDPKSYNPFSTHDGTHTAVTRLILDNLFEYDPYKTEWKGNLVEDFRVEFDEGKDTMELYCKLRDNIYWSDGVQMTSDDVVWWFNNIEADPEIDPVGSQRQFIVMEDGSVERYRIEKIDKLNFKYVFPRIVGNPLLIVNTGSIVPKHIWEPVYRKGREAVKDFWGIDTPPEKLVGNGPFLLENIFHGEKLVFRRNPGYWMKDEQGNSLPYIDNIILNRAADSNSELRMFQEGETDSYILRGQDFEKLQPDAEKGEYVIWNGGLANGYPALIFNHDNRVLTEPYASLFTDSRFKAAISCLIDRETIISQVLKNLAEPLYHFVSERNRYYNPDLAAPWSYDPEKAASLFAEIGLEDRNGDGFLQDSEGNTISFEILTSSSDPVLFDYFDIIISDLADAGIKTNLLPVNFNTAVSRLLYTGQWHAYIAGFNFPTFPEQWYNIWKSSGSLHYWNPAQEEPSLEWQRQIDELYDQLLYTYRDETVKELYSDFQKILIDEMVIIPIFRRYNFMAVKNRWGNINWGHGYTVGDSYRRLFMKDNDK